MVKKYFLIIFLKFLAVGDLFRYSLNNYRELVSTGKFDNSIIRERIIIPNERISELVSTGKFDNSKIREKK